MIQLESSTLSNQNISSALLVHTYTANADRELYIRLFADQIAGNGDYVAYITIQRLGAGSAYQIVPITTVAVASGRTAVLLTTIAIPVKDTDVVKVYLTGLGGDTTTPDIITEVWDADNASSAQVGSSVVEYPDAGRMMAGVNEAGAYTDLAVNDDAYWECTDPDNSTPLEMCVYINAGSGTFPDAVVIDGRYNAQNNRRVHVFAANVDDVAAISDGAATATDASPSVLTHSVAGSFAGLTLAGYDIYITSGTNATPGFYTIASHTDDAITLDRNCSSTGAVSSIDFIVLVWEQKSNDANAILHKNGADGDYEYPLGLEYMTTDNNEVFLRFSDEGQGTFKTSYDLRLDLVGVITKSLAGGSVSVETIAAAVHNELDDHFQHMPSFTGEVFYVSPTGSDANSGHDPTLPLLTIGAAITTASAGDWIEVKAGTYTEVGIDLSKSGLELHGEIGAIIDPASGSALTVSATSCLVDEIEVRPAAGEIGFDIASGSDGCHVTGCRQSTSGAIGLKIDSATTHVLVDDLQCGDYTSVGVEVNGADCGVNRAVCHGIGGTETGFKLNHTNAHHNSLFACSSIDNATSGYTVVSGADDNVFQSCSASAGCGGTLGRSDSGANNSWRGYMSADIDGVLLTSAERNAVADAVLVRAVENVEDTADKHSLGALVMFVTNWAISGSTLTAKKPSDDSSFQTYTLATDEDANPVSGVS